MKDITIKQAMNRLKKAFKDEPDHAYGWHANIAMMCYDAILSNDLVNKMDLDDDSKHYMAHNIGNDSASRFMKICFNTETSLDMLEVKGSDSE